MLKTALAVFAPSTTHRTPAATLRVYRNLWMEGEAMTDQQIIDYFDTHWDVTLAELSRMSGRSVKELKKLLLS